MNFLSSNSMVMMEKSMGFLWTKQAAILDNVANVETPNYKAKVVTFEESLRNRLEGVARNTHDIGFRRKVRNVLDSEQVNVFEAEEMTRMDDNGVNITEQMTEAARNAYQLQYVMQSISTDLQVTSAAVNG